MNKTAKHLQDSQMTYVQHLKHSMVQSAKLLSIAIKSVIHGIFPWFFINSGPLGIYKIYKEIKNFEHVRKIINDHKH